MNFLRLFVTLHAFFSLIPCGLHTNVRTQLEMHTMEIQASAIFQTQMTSRTHGTTRERGLLRHSETEGRGTAEGEIRAAGPQLLD